jgi:hypothetical protein
MCSYRFFLEQRLGVFEVFLKIFLKTKALHLLLGNFNKALVFNDIENRVNSEISLLEFENSSRRLRVISMVFLQVQSRLESKHKFAIFDVEGDCFSMQVSILPVSSANFGHERLDTPFSFKIVHEEFVALWIGIVFVVVIIFDFLLLFKPIAVLIGLHVGIVL